jgi:hypothetical protein
MVDGLPLNGDSYCSIALQDAEADLPILRCWQTRSFPTGRPRSNSGTGTSTSNIDMQHAVLPCTMVDYLSMLANLE